MKMKSSLTIVILIMSALCITPLYGQDPHKVDADTGDDINLFFTYALDAGISFNHSTADIGLSMLFRFYLHHLLPGDSLNLGAATGIVYENSSYTTYTLHSFPLLILLQNTIPIAQAELFMEIGAGLAFNYELFPISYFYISPAMEAAMGCTFVIYKNLRIGFFGKVSVNNILDIIFRSHIGARGELFF